ncbi:Glycosyltransferase involved in cell wall bisynthesis [Dehalogenimonas formicexedens]|uniref:Glycosyltransferase involved in cell wall bisynthesis n=1 Tax=Dehalogenimonas formicexedens TaxID=1839801 RepID=A0A1P8F7M0_9CHLR|nr:glycosyltransferase [Dehalogenimonas formicexedens]APV44433.1 Glycosyltransferase involved in cell wall bisynthesis [Dehalogenimonas formicexedens]
MNTKSKSLNTTFILLSFEGPDRYSLAGGLGARISNLSHCLGRNYNTHLFFIGDPRRRGEEPQPDSHLTLHRWCQWISEYNPNGVYQGENEKVEDYSRSIPPYVIETIIRPAVERQENVVVLSEEWHTAEATCRLGEQLLAAGLRNGTEILWNANNTFGFDRIDWKRLAANSTVTTVSKYMKHVMREKGINSVVIPNGIPEAMVSDVDDRESSELRARLKRDLLFTKVARFDPTKGWNEAIEATARLKRAGKKPILLARGGIEPFGEEVLYNAHQLGLRVKDVFSDSHKPSDCLSAVAQGTQDADLVNMKFHCSPQLLRVLYNASDAVLANSRHEPFGLVGLEAMAAGGVAFTGGTGEDYARHMDNAIVLESTDPREIEDYVTYLDTNDPHEDKIRSSARATAKSYTWEAVVKGLMEKVSGDRDKSYAV